MPNFTERVRECRNSKNLTQKQAASSLGLSLRVWQDYEYGTRTPTFNGLIALANFFDVSLDFLCGLSDDPARR
jgi:transcriptional regulator with XRE-family HTH domain